MGEEKEEKDVGEARAEEKGKEEMNLMKRRRQPLNVRCEIAEVAAEPRPFFQRDQPPRKDTQLLPNFAHHLYTLRTDTCSKITPIVALLRVGGDTMESIHSLLVSNLANA